MADTMDPLPQQSSFPVTPQSQISHLRANPRTATSPAATTRPRPISQHQHQYPQQQQQHQQLSAPASQESFISLQSTGASESSAAAASNLSQDTDDTEDLAGAVGVEGPRELRKEAEGPPRTRTPQHNEAAGSGGSGSPMSIVTSPVNVNGGAKRTASGHVKNAPSLPTSPVTFTKRHSRGESSSSTGSRAGDLAACLRTRLGYAMAKVQNGWEHRSIAEVEQLAAHKVLSNDDNRRMDYYGGQRPRTSGSAAERTSAFDQRYAIPSRDETASPPTKRLSGIYTNIMTTSPHFSYNPIPPRLQPAAEFRPLPLSSSSCSPSYPQPVPIASKASVMSPPRTPMSGQRRPQPLRTDTQTAQAERDAVQALFELGSPHASQMSRHTGASQDSSAQGSPLRSDFTTTPRKVTFARSDSGSGYISHLSEDRTYLTAYHLFHNEDRGERSRTFCFHSNLDPTEDQPLIPPLPHDHLYASSPFASRTAVLWLLSPRIGISIGPLASHRIYFLSTFPTFPFVRRPRAVSLVTRQGARVALAAQLSLFTSHISAPSLYLVRPVLLFSPA
nr:hypothetical protein CFP56_64760 [Quercus suber]